MSSGLPNSDYDMCLMIESPDTNGNSPEIRGQICHIDIPEILPTWEQYRKDPFERNMFDKIKFGIKQLTQTYRSDNRMKNFTLRKNAFEDAVFINDWRKTFAKLPLTLCLPTTCSSKDIEKAINKGLI